MSNKYKLVIGGNLLFIAGCIPAKHIFIWLPLLTIGWIILCSCGE